jgi:hypothetical protein
MNDQKWLDRLNGELHGWLVWRTGGTQVGVKWNAAPAAAGTPLTDYPALPNRITADTPAQLRSLARERYGWYDTCESCGVPARECGHRQPEREGARCAS